MASISVPRPKTTLVSRNSNRKQIASIPSVRSLFVNPSPCFSFGLSSVLQWSNKRRITVQEVRAHLHEVTNGNSLNPELAKDKSRVAAINCKEDLAEKKDPDIVSISELMVQASELMKLVDSRDIIELQLKQSDRKIVIRKKEALQKVAPSLHDTVPSYPYPTGPAAAPAAPAPGQASPAASSPAKASKPSQPAMISPMAGTFYCRPEPTAPPFIKEGDKVKKGQTICIIEAMKLMNEIQAEQSGTISKILVEDGKPVSSGTPLFIITP